MSQSDFIVLLVFILAIMAACLISHNKGLPVAINFDTEATCNDTSTTRFLMEHGLSENVKEYEKGMCALLRLDHTGAFDQIQVGCHAELIINCKK